MKLKIWTYDLKLTHAWVIARTLTPANTEEHRVSPSIFVELTDRDGHKGIGEAAPCAHYDESISSANAFLNKVDPSRLSFKDLEGSMSYLNTVDPGEWAAKGAIDLALLDGASALAGKSVHDFLGLGFAEGKHVTSFSIGIDQPDVIRQKVQQAHSYPILKLKVGSPADAQNLAALRSVAPTKTVRVDGNEAWKTRDEALRAIEELAKDPHIEFIEQPMPAGLPVGDFKWLKDRSPLPIMADESYISARDINRVADCFHAVNVKLVKAGGISGAKEALETAKRAGLKRMLGCMIESSVLISAAAHLADLTDYLDLDGNLLISNDPYCGVSAEKGVLSFASAPVQTGLQIRPRQS